MCARFAFTSGVAVRQTAAWPVENNTAEMRVYAGLPGSIFLFGRQQHKGQASRPF